MVLFLSFTWPDWSVMAADTSKPDPVDGHHRLVVCLPAGADSLDPTNPRSRITQIVLKHLFDSLTTRNGTMDNSEREALYHQIQELIFSEAPMIFGYAPDEFYAVAARVKGFHPPSTGIIELHDVNVDKER